MGRKHVNTLDMQKRFQILDWLRAHPDDLPNMTGDEIVDAVAESINHPCSLPQIREIAKAANMRWQVKRKPASGNTGSGGRMDRLEATINNVFAAHQAHTRRLLARIENLEAWCRATADGLGVEPPTLSALPSDDDL